MWESDVEMASLHSSKVRFRLSDSNSQTTIRTKNTRITEWFYSNSSIHRYISRLLVPQPKPRARRRRLTFQAYFENVGSERQSWNRWLSKRCLWQIVRMPQGHLADKTSRRHFIRRNQITFDVWGWSNIQTSYYAATTSNEAWGLQFNYSERAAGITEMYNQLTY